jgi:RNA polymerase sigma-70 factor (ECF subfamily)
MHTPYGSDTALFEAIASHDEAAFAVLYERYRERVYATALKWARSAFAAEEIVQEVFIGIWISRKNLPAVQDPAAYIFTIVFHQVNRHLKKEARARHTRSQVGQQQPVFHNETADILDANDSRQLLNKALNQLSPQKKQIYQLSREQGASYAEIGKQLGISPHTVKSHLFKAIKTLQAHLKKSVFFFTHLF